MNTDVIYLDYAKAFDKVDHNILLNKLKNIGITGKVLQWIKAFLSDRTQTVVINGNKSRPAKVISGVPQGTVLGPLLFLVYVNDIYNCINNVHISSFADDTRLLHGIKSCQDQIVLQEDLLNVIEWSNKNNMKLNDKKYGLLCHDGTNETLKSV